MVQRAERREDVLRRRHHDDGRVELDDPTKASDVGDGARTRRSGDARREQRAARDAERNAPRATHAQPGERETDPRCRRRDAKRRMRRARKHRSHRSHARDGRQLRPLLRERRDAVGRAMLVEQVDDRVDAGDRGDLAHDQRALLGEDVAGEDDASVLPGDVHRGRVRRETVELVSHGALDGSPHEVVERANHAPEPTSTTRPGFARVRADLRALAHE